MPPWHVAAEEQEPQADGPVASVQSTQLSRYNKPAVYLLFRLHLHSQNLGELLGEHEYEEITKCNLWSPWGHFFI